MINIQTEFLRIFILCSFLNIVVPLNYGVSAKKRSSPTVPSSASPAVFKSSSSTLTANRTIEISPGQKLSIIKTPYEIYYPLAFPQGRGGKNLNLTLVTKSSTRTEEQPRILNEPKWYSNSSVSGLYFKKLPAISQIPPLLQDNDNNRTPKSKDASRNPPYLPFTYPTKNYSKVHYSYQPEEDLRQPDLPKQTIRNSDTSSFTSPQQFRAPDEIPFSIVLQKNYKNAKVRYTFTPQNYQTTSGRDNFPPVREETPQNWPCFCVPYYLCKDGVINSGGRSIAAIRRRTRSLTFDSRNATQFVSSVQPKVMNAYVIEQESDPTQCEDKKVCCRLSFSDDVPDNRDDNYYPVATPRPEPYYPAPPPRYPDRQTEVETCGVRRALGLHARLRQLQYPADVSEFGEYPWQIAILRKIPGQKSLYICGGALISSQWIATAAHCIKNEQFSPLIIRLGEWDVNRRDEVYPYIEKEVDFTIIHPEFNSDTLYNDIALIRMKTPVDSRLPHITPVCLPTRETFYEDQKCWISGWGKDFFGPQGEYQSILKEVDVPVMMREVCISELRTTNLGPDFDLHPGFLCAGGEAGKDACTGDGGSPLVCLSGRTWYVVGLVSWGLGCGQPGIPGVYVNVLYYIDWINSIVRR